MGGEYDSFDVELEEPGETARVRAILRSSSGQKVGRVEYWPNWGEYCFYPHHNKVMSETFLNSLRELIEDLKDDS